MVNLKETFGRRMALVWLAVAAIAVCTCVCSIGLFSANAYEYDEGGISGQEGINPGVFEANKVYLTQNVVAPTNATFDTTYTYTFDAADATSGTMGQDPLVDYGYNNWSNALKNAIYGSTSVKTNPPKVQLRMKVDNGTMDETPVAYNKGVDVYKKALGNGISGINVSTWNENTQYPSKDETTLYGYIHQVPITSVLSGIDFTKCDASLATYDETYVDSLFPGDGNYGLLVTCSQNANPVPSSTWHNSKAKYLFVICVGHEEGHKVIRGIVNWQEVTDWGYEIHLKKNSYIYPGWSFHPYWKPILHPVDTYDNALVFEGFTFTHTLWQTPDETDYDTLTIQKGLTGNFQPVKEFEISNITIYSNTWNYVNEMKEDLGPKPAAPTKVTASILASDGTTCKGSVDFTVTAPSGAGNDYDPYKAFASSVKLGDGDMLIFDGKTHTKGASDTWATFTSDKIPTGSYYSFEEAGPELNRPAPESGYLPIVHAATGTTKHSTALTDGYKIPVTTKEGTITGTARTVGTAKVSVKVAYKTTSGYAQNANLIVGKYVGNDVPGANEAYSNIAYVQNHNDRDIYGFMVSCVPYLVLIGVPILAFVAWIILRRRKATR